MTPSTLTSYLHEQIPASRALGIEVLSCSDVLVELSAPLDANLNHKKTAFGGSLSVIAILAGWSLLYLRLRGFHNEIVIQQSSMDYHRAAQGDFVAICDGQMVKVWDRFMKSFLRRGRGRVEIGCQVCCSGEVVATFSGVYVAFNKGHHFSS